MENEEMKIDLKRDENGQFLPGHVGGPGRPKGKTIKERVRDWLVDHPDDMNDFVKHFVKKNRELTWQMLEGNPKSTFEGSIELPKPLDDVHKDEGVQEDKDDAPQNQSGAGGDIGE